MLKFLILATALVASSAYSEPVCELDGGETFAELEAAKADFLESNYQAFFAKVGRGMEVTADEFTHVKTQLETWFPDGFQGCSTVLQRQEIGGMVQEVVFFEVKGGDMPMSMWLLAAPFRDQLMIVGFHIDNQISNVLDQLY